jgi:peptidoglycan/xylan/chitin deacetylase (PgdA/CDA1 family)
VEGGSKLKNTDFPVVFGIDLDAESIWFNKINEGEYRPILFSQGAYAFTEALDPLLDLLDDFKIQSTFFIPGITAEGYPKEIKKIFVAGHEVASHGYSHRSITTLSREEEQTELLKGLDALSAITGNRPVTWRSPSWEFSKHTVEILVAAGIKASANFQDRSRPYHHQRDGRPLPLVELPVHWHLADAPYFLYGGLPGRIIHPTSTAFDVWSKEFVSLYEDRPGSYFHLTLHVQLIGHPSRLRMLKELITLIKEYPRAVFLRCDHLAASLESTQRI